jgi:predicted transcriptional regulator
MGSVKASFNLPEEELAQLKQLAQERRVSVTQALRQAIADSNFIEQQVRESNKLIVERPDGTKNEVSVHR